MLMKHTKVKDRETYDKVATVGLHHDGMLNVETMKQDAQWLHQKGYVKQQPDVNNIADLSYVKYAVEQLGPYK